MIPEFTEDGLLPEGIYSVTLEEFAERFAFFDRSDSEQLREYLDFFQTTRDGERMGIVEIKRC